MVRCSARLPSGRRCKCHAANGLTECYNHSSDCPVCLEKLGSHDEVCTLGCGHLFHATCMYKWLETTHTCPCCRQSVQIGGKKYRPTISVVFDDECPPIPRDRLVAHLRNLHDIGELPSTTIRVFMDGNNMITVTPL